MTTCPGVEMSDNVTQLSRCRDPFWMMRCHRSNGVALRSDTAADAWSAVSNCAKAYVSCLRKTRTGPSFESTAVMSASVMLAASPLMATRVLPPSLNTSSCTFNPKPNVQRAPSSVDVVDSSAARGMDMDTAVTSWENGHSVPLRQAPCAKNRQGARRGGAGSDASMLSWVKGHAAPLRHLPCAKK